MPLVTSPRAVGANAKRSSSARPLRPVTDGFPVVESKIRPSASRLKASILSLLASKPTSLPSKYMLKVPAVVVPSEVASNLKTSWGVTEIPLTVSVVVKDIRIESESSIANPNRSEPPTPTSDPSKNKLHDIPSNRRMSSSANATPPTVPSFAREIKAGLLETGVVVKVAVGVEVGVRVNVAVGVGVRVGVFVGVVVGEAVSETSQTLPSFSFAFVPLSTPRLAI